MYSFNEYFFYALCYLIGSIPFGILVARGFGVNNLTTQGSGNSGATNVARLAGKKAGIITLLLDFLKGFLPIFFFPISIFGNATEVGYIEMALYVSAALLVLGHCFSIFRKFKGGKGVATGLGIAFAIDYRIGLIAVFAWILVFLISKISSASALIAFGVLPIISFFLNPTENSSYLFFFIFLSILIYFKHWANIARLLNGEEKPFKK